MYTGSVLPYRARSSMAWGSRSEHWSHSLFFIASCCCKRSGLLIFLGVGITLGGVTLCGWGGYRREELAKSQGRGAGFSVMESAMAQTASTRKEYVMNVAIAFGAGALSALLNISLAFSAGIMDKVRSHGGQAAWAPFAVWPIALVGASLVNLAYSINFLFKNESWVYFPKKLSEIGNPVLAALMWMGAIALYSSATTYLGTLGISIGFALFTLTMIVSGNWPGSSPASGDSCREVFTIHFSRALAFLYWLSWPSELPTITNPDEPMLSREAGEALTLQVMGVLESFRGRADAAEEAYVTQPICWPPLKRSIPRPQR